MAIANTLQEFCEIFGRDEIDSGNVSFNQNPRREDAPENVRLTGQIEEFYSLLNFDELNIGGVLLMEIFSLKRLPDAQIGWRWITDSANGKVEDTKNWDENWTVFGDRNGDAIFVKTDDPLSPVYGTIQKTSYFQIADSLENFFNIINECLEIEEKEFGLEGETEDFEIKPEFLQRITETVNKFSPQNQNDFIEFFFD